MRLFIWKAMLVTAVGVVLAALLLGVWGVIGLSLVFKLVVTGWAISVAAIPITP